MEVYNTAITYTNFLMYSNSCLNPIIYSRIHERIYEYGHRFILKFRFKKSGRSWFNSFKKSTTLENCTLAESSRSKKITQKSNPRYQHQHNRLAYGRPKRGDVFLVENCTLTLSINHNALMKNLSNAGEQSNEVDVNNTSL